MTALKNIVADYYRLVSSTMDVELLEYHIRAAIACGFADELEGMCPRQAAELAAMQWPTSEE